MGYAFVANLPNNSRTDELKKKKKKKNAAFCSACAVCCETCHSVVRTNKAVSRQRHLNVKRWLWPVLNRTAPPLAALVKNIISGARIINPFAPTTLLFVLKVQLVVVAVAEWVGSCCRCRRERSR